MKILMFSLDPSLVGPVEDAEALLRHQKYAALAGQIDDIVLTDGRSWNLGKLRTYPSPGGSKLVRFFVAYGIGRGLARQNHYDIFLAQDPFWTAILARWFRRYHPRAKLIINLHGDFWGYAHPLKLKIGESNLRRADAIKVNTPPQQRKLNALGFDPGTIFVLPTPVDAQKVANGDGEKILKLFPQESLVLYVGRLEPEKNVSLLLKSWRAVEDRSPTARLLVLGDGSEKLKLVKQAQELKRVNFLGTFSSQELRDYYAACNFLVLPSTVESYGKVIVEAAASGKPVVATLTAGPGTLIRDHENGILVPINEAEALTAAILELLGNPDLARQLGFKAEQTIRVDNDRAIESIVNFWKEVVHR
jgi:glycosyltransferase involved in cell wall biosynthesis